MATQIPRGTVPGRPECSGRSGERRGRSRIADAVVEETESVTRDGVHVPRRLDERVRARDGHHQRQAGPQQTHVQRHAAAAAAAPPSSTTHVAAGSTHRDVPGTPVRPAAAVTALRRAVARHCRCPL